MRLHSSLADTDIRVAERWDIEEDPPLLEISVFEDDTCYLTKKQVEALVKHLTKMLEMPA